jgi:hypothetical protein
LHDEAVAGVRASIDDVHPGHGQDDLLVVVTPLRMSTRALFVDFILFLKKHLNVIK